MTSIDVDSVRSSARKNGHAWPFGKSAAKGSGDSGKSPPQIAAVAFLVFFCVVLFGQVSSEIENAGARLLGAHRLKTIALTAQFDTKVAQARTALQFTAKQGLSETSSPAALVNDLKATTGLPTFILTAEGGLVAGKPPMSVKDRLKFARLDHTALKTQRFITDNNLTLVLTSQRVGSDRLVVIGGAARDMLPAAPESWRVTIEDKSSLSAPPGARIQKDEAGKERFVAVANSNIAPVRLKAVAPPDGLSDAKLRSVVFYAVMLAAMIFLFGYLLQLVMAAKDEVAEAKTAKQNTEERFGVAIEAARCGVFEWSPTQDEVLVAKQMATLLGGAGGRVTQDRFLDRVHPDDRAALLSALDGAAHGQVANVIFRAGSKEDPVWLRARGQMIGLEGGQLNRIVCVAMDVTNDKKLEMRRLEAENHLSTAMTHFSGPFALWDSRRRLVRWNNAFARTFQLDPRGLREGAHYDTIRTAIHEVVRSEYLMPHDKHERVVELLGNRFIHLVERPTINGGMITFGTDVSTLKMQERALLDSERELRRTIAQYEKTQLQLTDTNSAYLREKINAEQASKAKTDFLATMSHELRTPLNAIIGFAELMQMEPFGDLNDNYKQNAADIELSGKLLLELIEDILDMAKIESGKMPLEVGQTDPLEAIEATLVTVRRRATERGVDIQCDYNDLPMIEADARSLRQMVTNLVANAVKFTDEGGTVTILGRTKGDAIEIEVRDTGIGIAEADIEKLGRPFVQVGSPMVTEGRGKGTGLGLALTRSLAAMHGGRLEIKSKLGEGTSATIILPINGPKASEPVH